MQALRKAIEKAAYARVDMKQQLEYMKVYKAFMIDISIFKILWPQMELTVNAQGNVAEMEMTERIPKVLEEYTHGRIKSQLDECSRDKIVKVISFALLYDLIEAEDFLQMLQEFDQHRLGGAWTNEDPQVDAIPDGATPSMMQSVLAAKTPSELLATISSSSSTSRVLAMRSIAV